MWGVIGLILSSFVDIINLKIISVQCLCFHVRKLHEHGPTELSMGRESIYGSGQINAM